MSENEIFFDDHEMIYNNGIGMEYRLKKKKLKTNKNSDKKEKKGYEKIKNGFDGKLINFLGKKKKLDVDEPNKGNNKVNPKKTNKKIKSNFYYIIYFLGFINKMDKYMKELKARDKLLKKHKKQHDEMKKIWEKAERELKKMQKNEEEESERRIKKLYEELKEEDEENKK